MGIFDSKSSSEQTTTSQNGGFSEVGGSAQAVNLSFGKKSKNNAVTLTDYGAVSSAFGFGSQALKQIELLGAQSAAGIEKAISAVNESARSETENVAVNWGKWVALAAIAFFVANAFAKR